MLFNLTRTVAPTVRPIEVGEAMEHLRVDGDEEQQLVSALIDAAVTYMDGPQGILGRCIMEQTWRAEYQEWPDSEEIVLPVSPVQSVTLQYRNDAGTWVTMTSGTAYELVRRGDGLSLILPPWNGDFPTTGDYRLPIRADIVAGDDAPNPALVQAIKLLIGHWFANREAASEMRIEGVPLAFHALTEPHRRVMVT